MAKIKKNIRNPLYFNDEIFVDIPANAVKVISGRYSISSYGRILDKWNEYKEILPYIIDDTNTLYIDLFDIDNNFIVKKTFNLGLIVAITFNSCYNLYGYRNIKYLNNNCMDVRRDNIDWDFDPVTGVKYNGSNKNSIYSNIPNPFENKPKAIINAYLTMYAHPDMLHKDILKLIDLYPSGDPKDPITKAMIKKYNDCLSRIRRREYGYKYTKDLPDIPRNPNANPI